MKCDVYIMNNHNKFIFKIVWKWQIQQVNYTSFFLPSFLSSVSVAVIIQNMIKHYSVASRIIFKVYHLTYIAWLFFLLFITFIHIFFENLFSILPILRFLLFPETPRSRVSKFLNLTHWPGLIEPDNRNFKICCHSNQIKNFHPFWRGVKFV